MCKYVAPPVLSIVGVTVLAVGNPGCCWSRAACLVWGSLASSVSHPGPVSSCPQVVSTSSRQSTQNTARPTWTARPRRAAHRPPQCWVWGAYASALTAQMVSRTESCPAVPPSQTAALCHPANRPSPSRSCPTSTSAAPRTPPTWMCSASTASSISSTSRPTCPMPSSTGASSPTSRSPSLTTGARTSPSSSLRPSASSVSAAALRPGWVGLRIKVCMGLWVLPVAGWVSLGLSRPVCALHVPACAHGCTQAHCESPRPSGPEQSPDSQAPCSCWSLVDSAVQLGFFWLCCFRLSKLKHPSSQTSHESCLLCVTPQRTCLFRGCHGASLGFTVYLRGLKCGLEPEASP